MKVTLVSLLGLANSVLAAVQGFDISHFEATVNFTSAYNSGARFVIIKATEGVTYVDNRFSSHHTGATKAGLIRGSYHYAHLESSSGAKQAAYFLANGGGWTNDGITLPGMLDLEGTCELSVSQTVAWIKDFSDTYRAMTGVYPLICTSASWWTSCTGNSNAFVNNPLVLIQYAASPGTLPGGWPTYTIWQYDNSYRYGGNSDSFNGDMNGLIRLAKG